MEKKSFTDALTTLAKGTDAGLYRLIPERVAIVDNEESVVALMIECKKLHKSVTFKAGGTSLSGQTVTRSVLAEIAPDFGNPPSISSDGLSATYPCNITGERANKYLAKYGRKLGPSPASIKSARIGGIVSNNASGSSYGIKYNSYNTVQSMRIILADGFILDTSSKESREKFKSSHKELVNGLSELRQRVLDNPEMLRKIRHKYEIKNTCGYGVNSLVDYEDPVDILMHLMIGSEGTLGFISEVTFRTVPDHRLKASALIFYPSMIEACKSIIPLRRCTVSAAELMDRNALRAVENDEGMPSILKELPENAVALLIDTAADDEETLKTQFAEIEKELSLIHTLYPITFTTDPNLYATYWNVRSGLFTSAAAGRPRGTVSIIEDIAFRGEILGEALTAVREVLAAHNYPDAVMWGHLLDGNVHFTIFPDINRPEGVEGYKVFMKELTDTVLKYDGSLKAEHGTGRNMAAFVRQEWGDDIYELMKDIKHLIDPEHLLNPGVIINETPDILIADLKLMPLADDLIDKCIECGFCEVKCPARNLTLTPRQRIVVYRRLAELQQKGEEGGKEYKELKKAFEYKGNDTCATDGLCATACPVGINTGMLIKQLRWKENSRVANIVASAIADHIDLTTAMLRPALSSMHILSRIGGYEPMEMFMKGLFKMSGHRLPLWTRYTPAGTKYRNYMSDAAMEEQPEVVYFPSCITRTMGASADYDEKADATAKTIDLLHKAGYAIRYPQPLNSLCCGMAFSSKGFRKQAKQKEDQLNQSLLAMSDNGQLPILCDMSPCLLHMRETLDKRLKLYEPVEFIHDFLMDRLEFTPIDETVAIHSTCSTTKMGVTPKLLAVASKCAIHVVVPEDVGCCAWAGDRGFFYPELNDSALRSLAPETQDATSGYSNSRTCEIGLTMHSGISYRSIVYLVDKATRAKE